MTRKTNAQLLAENKKLTNKVKRLEKKAAEAESTLDIMTQQHEKDVADLAQERDHWRSAAEHWQNETEQLQDKVADLTKDRDEWKEVAEGLKDRAENLITLQRTLKDKVADLELSEAAARKEWDQWREKALELSKDRDEWKAKEDSARLAAAKASAELFHVKEEVKKLNKDLEQCGREVNRRTTACELKDKAILNLRLKVANQRKIIEFKASRQIVRMKGAEYENTGGMTIGNGLKTLTTGTVDWRANAEHWKQKRDEWKRRALAAEHWQKTAEDLQKRIAELEAQIPPADLMTPASNDPANYSSTGDIKLTLPGILMSPDEIPFGAEIGETFKIEPVQTFQPGTVGYWLDKMDEPERSRALKNADLVLDLLAPSVQYAVNMFTWNNTPQGADYWNGILKKYANK